MMNRKKLFVVSTIAILTLQAALILLSWIISAVFPAQGINSLLSDAGIRWLLSTYVTNGYSDFLIWFLFCSFFAGTFFWSRLPQKIASYSKCNYNDKFAIKVFLCELLIGIAVCIIIAIYPHSSLLGITGELFPGPFLKAVFLIFGISIFLGSLSFLIISGRVKSLEDAEKPLLFGLKSVVPLIVIFFMLKETLEIILFVLRK